MALVEFHDFSAEVSAKLQEKAEQFLDEASFELESQVKRTTPTTEPQLKGSWDRRVDAGERTATVGSPLEQSLWNEFGTGSYAENGNGRKGWWVYIEGQGKSSRVSKTYPDQKAAEKAVRFLRGVKKLPAVASNGKEPQKTLRNAYAAKKDALIRRARQIFGSDD